MLGNLKLLLFPGESQQGAALVEYLLIISLIAIAIILSVTSLGEGVRNFYEGIVANWPS